MFGLKVTGMQQVFERLDNYLTEEGITRNERHHY
jgi:hypothetical protein